MALPKTYCLEDLEREAALCNFLVLTHDLEVALGGGEDLSSSAFPRQGLSKLDVGDNLGAVCVAQSSPDQVLLPVAGLSATSLVQERRSSECGAGTHCLTVLSHVVLHCEKTMTMSG